MHLEAGLPGKNAEVANCISWQSRRAFCRTKWNGIEGKKNLSVTRKPKNVDNNVDKRVTELKELDKENT